MRLELEETPFPQLHGNECDVGRAACERTTPRLTTARANSGEVVTRLVAFFCLVMCEAASEELTEHEFPK